MRVAAGDCELYSTSTGTKGPVLLAIHGLGLDQCVWDSLFPLLHTSLRVIRYDLRGHGRSDAPDAPYRMGRMIQDAEAVMQAQDATDAIVVGQGVGGMVAQGLATKRLDLVRGLVLTGTAARMGNVSVWERHMDEVRRDGLSAHAQSIAKKLSVDPRTTEEWRARIAAMSKQGYLGTCAAISGSDFYTTTAALRLPTIGLSGRADQIAPPDLMRETIDLIPDADLHLINIAGHLTALDQPLAFAEHLNAFCERLGHV